MFLSRRPHLGSTLSIAVFTLGWAWAASAQVGVPQRAGVAPVGVTPTQGVSPVGSAPVQGAAQVGNAPVQGAAPIGSAPVKSAAPVGVAASVGVQSVGAPNANNASLVNMGLLLLIGQIADGQMTLDEAWNKGLLDAPKVLQLLSQTQRFTENESNEALQRDLAGLLVKRAPTTVATPDELSARVRIALCRYYSSIGDARAVPLCEALIAEKLEGKQVKQPLASNPDGGSSSLWLFSVITLAQYYENTEQWQKAGETWERALGFWQNVDWWQAGVRIDAARAYKKTGTSENYTKAKQLYLQAARSSNARYAGGAVIEGFSQELKNNPEQAQNVLLQLQEEIKVPDVRLATQFLLAWARYKAGDWEAFLRQAEQVTTQYENIEQPSRRRTFAPLAIQIEDGQKWAKLWQKSSIVVENPDLGLRFDGPLQQPIERRIFVDTDTPTALQVTVEGDTDRVSARIEASLWAPELADVRHQQIVVVTIAAGEPKASAVIRIANAANKDDSLLLPIHVSANEMEVTTP